VDLEVDLEVELDSVDLEVDPREDATSSKWASSVDLEVDLEVELDSVDLEVDLQIRQRVAVTSSKRATLMVRKRSASSVDQTRDSSSEPI
jgi:hypothetical protein